MKKIELYILLASIVLGTTVMSFNTLDQTYMIRHLLWVCFTLVLFASVSARAIIKPASVDFGILYRWIFPLFFAYLAMSVISITPAIHTGEGRYGVLKIFMMFVYLFAAATILKDNFGALCKTFTVLAFGLSLFGVYQFFADDVIRTGTMANKNLWSGAMLLLLPFCIYMVKKWPYLAVPTIGLMLFNIFTILARSVILGLCIASVFVCLFNKRLFPIILASAIGCALILCWKGTTVLSSASLMLRWELWGRTIQMTSDRFMTGIENWKFVFPKYLGNVNSTPAAKTIFTRPHNDFLWALSELGWPGLVFYIGIFGSALWYAIKSRALWLVFGITGYIVFCSFSYPRERPFHSMMWVILLAAAVAAYHKKTRFKLSRSAIICISVCVIGVLIWTVSIFSTRYLDDVRMKRIYILRQQNDWPAVIETVRQCSKYALDPLGMPVLWYEAEALNLSGQKAEAMQRFSEALLYHPNHIMILANVGSFYAQRGDKGRALYYYHRVLEINPNFDAVRRNLEYLKR